MHLPLVVPPVNGGHLELVRTQASFAASGGFSACARARARRWRRACSRLRSFRHPALAAVVTNANCSTTGLVIALKPIHDAFGIVSATVATLQVRHAAREQKGSSHSTRRQPFLPTSLRYRRRYPARATPGCRRWTFWTTCCR